VNDQRVAREARRLIKVLAGPGADRLTRAGVALQLAEAADRAARVEIAAARQSEGASWADVGEALGVVRQSAHERFRAGPDGGHSRLTNS
jgi:hypothetical protein